ncbi:MAG TPA: glutathione S-transferase N-terminal domain-containing protein [Sphingopyxis sp.]|nr:glutathione S-transferase N-terminal domain-containing protein [Sphingopyxis sp.]HMP45977.1 glutathione S-transferase N-terminal domain-containing protein [Sphingopyxis sp.]HMQ17833.1 glutathione S-transferase N-terminal domain-containing protein [Sphingopyxis sp.]
MIDLHYSATPNGQKIAILLEEIGAAYRVIPYDIFAGDQLTPEFGRINPNHKLPAIIDHAPVDGGEPVAVFESGAILQYLAEKAGRFLPASGAARAAALSWLTWQVAGLGPMGGQASHFLRYAPPGQDYAVARYTGEVQRLLTVLEKRLEASAYVAGEDYTIADMAIWPGRASAFVMGQSLDEWPATRIWFERIRARPAVARAMERGDLKPPEKYLGRHQKLDEREWSNMFGEANRAAVRGD